MLASHALVLLGVPLNRVVKRIRLFREERYKMFKGFFGGLSDIDKVNTKQRVNRLHSVEVTAGTFAQGQYLEDINFTHFDVALQYIRRPNMLEDIHPRPDIMLAEGDVLVLLGSAEDLVAVEIFLISGN